MTIWHQSISSIIIELISALHSTVEYMQAAPAINLILSM
jgi:hypothetical protein